MEGMQGQPTLNSTVDVAEESLEGPYTQRVKNSIRAVLAERSVATLTLKQVQHSSTFCEASNTLDLIVR